MAESADKSPSANPSLDEESDVVELTDEVGSTKSGPEGDDDGFESMELEMPEFKVPGQDKVEPKSAPDSMAFQRGGDSGATKRLSKRALDEASMEDSSKGEQAQPTDDDAPEVEDDEEPEYDRQAMVKTIQMEAIDRSTIEGMTAPAVRAITGTLDDARFSPEIIPFPPQVLVKKWREGLPGEVELIVGNDISTATPTPPSSTEEAKKDAESLPELPGDSAKNKARPPATEKRKKDEEPVELADEFVELAEESEVELLELVDESDAIAEAAPSESEPRKNKKQPKKKSDGPSEQQSSKSQPASTTDSEMKGLVQEMLEEEKEQKARRTARIRPRDVWFQKVFSEDYLRTVPSNIVEITRREADFIEASMGLKEKSRMLDLACGFGRHSIELASRGYEMVGLDLSMPLLQRALDAAKKRSLNVKFIHGDMRELNFSGIFDGCVIWDTSLGYFDDRTNLGVLQGVNRGLKVGGRILVDVVNRDFVVNQTPTRLWWEGNGCIFLEESEFDYHLSTLEVQRSYIFEDGSPPMEHTSFIRLYNVHELRQMLHVAGFKVLEISGGQHYQGHFLGASSERIIILAEKRKKRKPSK